MRKILVINMNYIGDALLTTPALAALRRANPDARIDTVVREGPPADVLLGNPDVNHIIARTARGSLGRCMQIYRLLRKERYDEAIVLPAIPVYALAAFLARTPVRVGLANHGMNRFLTRPMPTSAIHMADAMLDTVSVPKSARSPRPRLTVTLDRADCEFAEALLVKNGIDLNKPLIAVNPGTTRPQKRWFPESFAEMLGLVDMQTVLIGNGENEKALARVVLENVKGDTKVVSIVGDTSIKQLGGVLTYCDLVVSADSGPMHLATAVGTPVIALFGSTDPAVSGPYDTISRSLYKSLPCSPCGSHPTCNNRFDCLRSITPLEVANAVRSLVRERRKPGMTNLAMATQEAAVGQSRLADAPMPMASTLPKERGHERTFHRILFATKFRFIGDTILAIPIFRAARIKYPDAYIVLLTGKIARVLLQNNPYLDEIIEFDPYQKDTGQSRQLVRRLRRSRFDLCLALNRSFHSALLTWLGGIGTRAGFKSEGRGVLLNRRVDYDKEKSEIACYFDVLRAVAPDVPVDPALELWVTREESDAAKIRIEDALRCAGDPEYRLAGIQPGASQDGKRWPVERFAAVADALAKADPRVRIALVGGQDETDVAARMVSLCAEETRARLVSFTGQCNLRESLGIVSHLHLFVGNDTAVMHMAVALGVPTVSLFGPTNPRKWGNYGECHRVLESADGTMAGITVASVATAALDLLCR